MTNQNKKLAKVLAATIFGVGFVTPAMFSNIAEAANFGKGSSTTPTFTTDQIDAAYAYKSTGSSSISNDNCLMINGYRFKVVGNTTTNGKQILTLWSYDKQDHSGTTGFGTSTYSSGSTWCTGTIDQAKIQAAYNNNVISTNTNALLTVDTATGKATAGKLYGDEASKNIVYIPYTSTGINNEANVSNAYIWLPSTTEVTSAAWGDGTNALTTTQRVIGEDSWLRSPDPGYDLYANYVDYTGNINHHSVAHDDLLRPALQILNQTSCVFTTNVAIPTDGVFTADKSDGTNYAAYALNNTATIVPTFTPATDGVTLDGTKIGITTKHSQTGGSDNDYATTGLLTTNSGTTWKAINTGDNANIAYMAQVKDGYLDLQNVEGTGVEGAGYTLKMFGLNTTDTAVTELASGAITGLSKGADGKIHMKVSGTVNAGVPVTVSNGAVVDFGGGALAAKLDLKSGGNLAVNGQLNFGTNSYVKQEIGSEVEVPVDVIESDTNVAGKAMFTGVDSTADLNVASGNLTIIDGPVTDGKYYVLVAGDAVEDGTLQAGDLWKKEKIALDTSNYFLADYDYVTNGNAIALKIQAATVEEANTSGLAAVQQGALAVSKEFTGEVENHLGMIANPKLADKEKYNKEVWATYINTKETTEGMKLEGIEGNNTAKYSGAVVGVDFYSSKKAIAGMAFSYTKGDVDSYSGTTATKNDAKYYGVSFYDRVTNGNTAMIYDIGYIRGNNDVSQYYNGKPMTSDVKTNTYTAGARLETAIETGKSRVVPFAAFRYMRVNNGDYTNSHNTRFEAKNQNLYIPKVGIAWTGDFVAPNSVCTWRPSVEVGYLWNLGDRSAESNVLVGTRMTDIGYDIADRNSFYGKAGIELMAKNFTAGVFYRYLKGNAVKNNKWNINMAWKF